MQFEVYCDEARPDLFRVSGGKMGSLICYAGSATEASIDSRPLGRELHLSIPLLKTASQMADPLPSGGLK